MTAKQNNAVRLVHLNGAAEALGLERGQGLTDARAAWPSLEVIKADGKADATLLAAIASWCGRYTPLVAIDEPVAGEDFGLILDITGCAHLFGGEHALVHDLLTRLFHQGFAAEAAIAPTPGAAWALARFHVSGNPAAGHHGPYAPPPILGWAGLEACLTPLPVAALRLVPETVESLARLGLRIVGQLMARPRAPLARRFGREVLMRLDQALGEVEEAVSPLMPVAEMMAERRFAEPLVLETDIERATLSLAGHLAQSLQKRGLGLRQVRLSLYRVDGAVFHLEAGASRPERDPGTVLRLLRERFSALHDDFDAGYGFETLRLGAMASDRMEEVDGSFLKETDRSRIIGQLIDRLTARLGTNRVVFGRLQDTHLPEEAEEQAQVADQKPATAPDHLPDQLSDLGGRPGLRPLRLFAGPEPVEAMAEVPDGPPVRFRWRKVSHEVTRVEGPERIADRWWQPSGPRPTRDYFRVEDRAGRRYWLFREGLYGRETEAPRWFIHGLFA